MPLTKADIEEIHVVSAARIEAEQKLVQAKAAEDAVLKSKAPKAEPNKIVRNHVTGTTAFLRIGDDLFETPIHEPEA